MKPFSAGLDSVLAGWAPSSDIAMADLYTFSLPGGEVLRYSGAQTAITVNDLWGAGSVNAGGDYTFALGPRFDRTKSRSALGSQPAELDIEIYAGPDDLIGNITWQAAARWGLFDGATVELDRCFMQPYGSIAGTMILFFGRTGEISVGRSKLEMKAVDLRDMLNIRMPRRLYQAACNHVFGDAMCGFNRASLAVTIDAGAGSLQSQIAIGFAPSPAALFNSGTIVGVTGQNAAYTRTISSVSEGTGNLAYLLKAFLFPVAVGDAFTLYPGCDHTVASCQSLFDNLARFGGFPYIPPPEDAI